MTLPIPTKGCTCFHLGPSIHDPTNPNCALFSGAALRLTGTNDQGDDDDPTPDAEDLQPPIPDDTGEPPLHPHAFTNYCSPGGLCTVCGKGNSDVIHALNRRVDAELAASQVHLLSDGSAVFDEERIQLQRPIKADHLFVYTVGMDNVIVCGECGHPESEHFGTHDRWKQNIRVIEPEPIPGVVETLNTAITLPSMMVNVDFNELMRDTDEEKAYEIIGKLKDLLS